VSVGHLIIFFLGGFTGPAENGCSSCCVPKWLGAINTPNHHNLWYPSFLKITFNTRALAFNPRHNTKDQILSKPQIHSKHLVACERDFCVHLNSYRLDCLSSFPILILKCFVSKARDTKCVVVLAGS
jgi:hypothetical protein